MNILLLGLIIILLVSVAHAGTFLLDNEGWMINQGYNKIYKPGLKEGVTNSYAEHFKYNTGNLNHYIGGKDTLINVDGKNKDDRDLWYFVSPIKIVGKGPFAITFSMSSFMGDFKKMNAGVRDRAIIIRTNTSEYWLSLFEDYDGTPKTYWIPLHIMTIRKKENDGTFSKVNDNFRKNISFIENSILKNIGFSEDRGLQKLLEKVNEIAILGDWTQGVEMIGLDNVAIEAML